MHSNEYQELAWSTVRPFYKCETDNTTFRDLQFATTLIGMQSKCGELSDSFRKTVESGQGIDHHFREECLMHLGGILWFVAAASKMLGLTLEDVMQKNISALREKYPTGVLQNKNTKF